MTCRRNVVHGVAAILVCLSTVNSAGTSVAVYRTPQRIAVAADTLASVSSQATHECKIYRDGAMIFALVNLIRDKKSGFNARTLAHSAASAASIHDAALRFKRLVLPAFAKALRRIQRDGPELYAKTTKGDTTSPTAPLSALFLGVEHGVPKFSIVAVKILDDTHGRMRLDADLLECPGSYCADANGIGWTVLGQNEAVVKESNNGSFLLGLDINDPVSAVRKAVELEIAAKPDAVGRPVDIVIIDSLGIHAAQVGLCHF